MRILDQNGVEIEESAVDRTLGYLKNEELFVAHHEATDAIARKVHYIPTRFYLENGDTYVTALGKYKDEHGVAGGGTDVAADERVVEGEHGTFGLKMEDGTVAWCGDGVLRGIDVEEIVDQEAAPAQEAYDETETIQRYVLYTEAELADIKARNEKMAAQAQFMETGPDRLDSAEVSLDDVITLVADLIGA